MSFIVIETHGGAEYAIIVTDQEGNNMLFDSYLEALQETNACQAGMVVEL